MPRVSGGIYSAEPRLLANRTERFPIAAGKTLGVFLSRQGTEATLPLRYRLFVYPVNRDPEHGPGTVTLGQVRDDEDLETSADIDEYALVGQRGRTSLGTSPTPAPAPWAPFHSDSSRRTMKTHSAA